MSTNFAVPVNNASTTVSVAKTTTSLPYTLTVTNGAVFPALTGSQYYRVTVCQVAFAYSPTATTSNYTIYKADTVSGNTIVLESVLEGTTDKTFAVGDIVEIRVTAGTLSDIQGAVNTLETAGSGVTIGAAVTGGTANRVLYEGTSHVLADSSGLTFDGTKLSVVGPASDVDLMWISANSANTNSLSLLRTATTQKNTITFYGTNTVADPSWNIGLHANSSTFYYSSFDTTNAFIQFFQLTPGVGCQFGNTAMVTIRGDGSIVPVTMANASAVNSSLFIDSSAGNKLCWKDSGGTLHYST